jgi:hypothetical protein
VVEGKGRDEWKVPGPCGVPASANGDRARAG